MEPLDPSIWENRHGICRDTLSQTFACPLLEGRSMAGSQGLAHSSRPRGPSPSRMGTHMPSFWPFRSTWNRGLLEAMVCTMLPSELT